MIGPGSPAGPGTHEGGGTLQARLPSEQIKPLPVLGYILADEAEVVLKLCQRLDWKCFPLLIAHQRSVGCGVNWFVE